MISPFYQLSDHTQVSLLFSHEVMPPSLRPHGLTWSMPGLPVPHYLSECLWVLINLRDCVPEEKKIGMIRDRDDIGMTSSFLLVFLKSMTNQNCNYSGSLLGRSHYGSVILCLLASSSQDKTPTTQSSWWNPCSTYVNKYFSKFPRTLTFSSKTASQ